MYDNHIHRPLKRTLSNEYDIHQYIEPVVGNSSIIVVKANNYSTIEYIAIVENYKKKLYSVYNTINQLQNNEISVEDNYHLIFKKEFTQK